MKTAKSGPSPSETALSTNLSTPASKRQKAQEPLGSWAFAVFDCPGGMMLSHEHRVPKGEKAVFFPHRLLVGRQHVLPPRQGGHQHDEGGLGQVEIGDEGVQHLKAVTGVDEDVGPPRRGLQRAVLPGPALTGSAECISCSSRFSTLTGRKVPSPT